MSIQSLRIIRLFLWGILLVALLTVGTMYLLKGSLLAKKKMPQAIVVDDPARSLRPLGTAPSFVLESQNGGKFDSATLKGSVYVVDFFFTECKGICPKLQKNMKSIQAAFADDGRVKLVSISVDPKNDTVARLKQRAAETGADDAKWLWLRGPTEETGRIAKEFKLVGTEVPGDILHSNRFVLVDGYGSIRGYYNGTEDADVAAIKKDIARLLGA
jgi:protein SCO1/2